MRLTPLSSAKKQTPAPPVPHFLHGHWNDPSLLHTMPQNALRWRDEVPHPLIFCSAQIATALQSPSTASQDTIHIRSASVRLRLLSRPPVRLTRRSTAKLLLSPALILVPRRLARASGEPYPPKPVRIIIPYPAGGPYDGIPRLIAQWIGAKHGWSIVMADRAGATGILGVVAAKQAAPDRHTLV